MRQHLRPCPRHAEGGGGHPEDVVKMDFWVPDPASGRAIVNQEWVKMFPDFDSCPSRHTHTTGGGGQTIQATFMAYIDRG